MKRMLLKIAYDGTAYHGWQVQPNGITVQETMQDALEKLLGVRPDLTGCSRTDAGVHAKEFYCHLDCEDFFPPDAFLKGLNSILPDDICVTGCEEKPRDFHARYSALGKRYSYRMYTGTPDPFLSRYALRLETAPDLEKSVKFCEDVCGKHDFSGFSASGRTVKDTVRTVKECRFIKDTDGLYKFEISADGFLYNMVRIMAGTALEIACGLREHDCAEKVFETGNRSIAGKTLAPRGLFLDRVFYSESEL